jgi:uncharacterized membrane protein
MSSNPETSKTLAAIGALLLFLPVIPGIGIVGLILLFIGLKGLSNYYQDQSIYQNAFRGLIYGIIGVIAVSVVTGLGIFGGMFSAAMIGFGAVIVAVITIILALVIAFIFYLLMAINFRRAFDALEQRSGEHQFHTAGTLMYYGALLTIILVGVFLVWIAWLFAALAFFAIKLAPTQPAQQQYGYAPPPPPTAQTATKYCPNCGAPVQPGTTFCPNCGKQLPPS